MSRILSRPEVMRIALAEHGYREGANNTCTNANGTPCTKDGELGFYAAISLALGIKF